MWIHVVVIPLVEPYSSAQTYHPMSYEHDFQDLLPINICLGARQCSERWEGGGEGGHCTKTNSIQV